MHLLIRSIELLSNQKSLRVGMDTTLSNLWILMHFKELKIKTLWSRFKRQSNLLEQGQTLYSFRHSGAIEIFKRIGSLTEFQKAMGHSSINVSLTYLRGLEITELKEEDAPMV